MLSECCATPRRCPGRSARPHTISGLACGAPIAPALATASKDTITLDWADPGNLAAVKSAAIRVTAHGTGLPESYGAGRPTSAASPAATVTVPS